MSPDWVAKASYWLDQVRSKGGRNGGEAVDPSQLGVPGSIPTVAARYAEGADRFHSGHGTPDPESRVRVTHPLCAGPVLAVQDLAEPWCERLDERLERQADVADPRTRFLWLWRCLRAELLHEVPPGIDPAAWSTFGALEPASRHSPDHTVWDHARLVSALAFSQEEPITPDRAPWLVVVEVGPVKAWVRDARTTRDLWTGSMLLAELSLAAMEEVIGRVGPDAVLYPDLSANLRYDQELVDDLHLQGGATDLPTSRRPVRAALVPNLWLAVMPRAAAEELREALPAAVTRRWTALADEVLELVTADPSWNNVAAAALKEGRQQVRDLVAEAVSFTAIPWLPTPDQEYRRQPPGRTLPGQQVDEAAWAAWTKSVESLGDRYRCLDPNRVRAHAERLAAAGEDRGLGADYPLAQAEVRKLHRATAPIRGYARARLEGPTCTVCGRRAAIGGRRSGRYDDQLEVLRAHWKQVWAGEGWDDVDEILCGVCAARRLLFSKKLPQVLPPAVDRFHRLWSGGAVSREDGRVRLPFPSTAAVAAAPVLREVLAAHAEANERAAQELARLSWPRTFFPEGLPSVGRSLPTPPPALAHFEPTWLFDGSESEPKTGQDVRALRARWRDDTKAKPDPHVAVIAVDGDRLGSLLAGDPRAVGVPWRNVLAPGVVVAPERSWALDLERPVGPSLQAFVSRACTEFANRIVPWVVEREFHGKLVYAGGDDVLAMAPAQDALGIVARLQQLWSAAWVLDTDSGASPWDPTRWDSRQHRRRFLVPSASSGTVGPRFTNLEEHAWSGETPEPADGVIVPMLGPGQSLSAGIAYGHYKTPLRELIAGARDALDDVAKERAGRECRGGERGSGWGAVAEVWRSRGGAKVCGAVRWRGRGSVSRPWERGALARRLAAILDLRRVEDAFATGTLPRRLPYELRELGLPMVSAAVEGVDLSDKVLTGLVVQHAERAPRDVVEAAARIWGAGLDMALATLRPGPGTSPDRRLRDRGAWEPLARCSADLLIVRRELATARGGGA